jgi:hypothetical protein
MVEGLFHNAGALHEEAALAPAVFALVQRAQ